MFDPVTIDLIGRAPPLGDLDFSELPQRFTNAFAEIVAARVLLLEQQDRLQIGRAHV